MWKLRSESDSILIYLVQTNNLSSSVRGQEGRRVRGAYMGNINIIFSTKLSETGDDDEYFLVAENVESLWGPIPLARLPPGVDNTCRAVTHG